MNEFFTIGEFLKNKREQLGFTTKEMEEKTKVRQRFLDALENGEYDKLPGEAYIKGFLKIYCEHLGIDYQELIAGHSAFKQPETNNLVPTYDKVPASPRSSANSSQQFLGGEQPAVHQFTQNNKMPEPLSKSFSNERKIKQKKKKKIKFRFLIWIILLAFIAAGGYLGYNFYQQHNDVKDVEDQINQQLEENTVPAADEEAPASTNQNNSEVVSPVAGDTSNAEDSTSPFKISFETSTERCWVEIYADDSLYYRGMIEAEDVKTVLAKDKISIKTNNAGAVKALINGKDSGFLGGDGEVATKEYLASAYQ